MIPAATLSNRGARLLTLCGLSSFALALLHVACLFLGEGAARFFNAPPLVLRLIQQGSLLIVPVCLAIAGVLSLFGLYAWSAAGRIRRLPLLRTGALAVGLIYTLRGLLLFPQLVRLLHHPGLFGWQTPVFSATALVLGLSYLRGIQQRWPALGAAGHASALR